MNKDLKCPVCGNEGKIIIEDAKDYFVLDGNSPSFGISYCASCAIGNSFPHLSDSELAKYYPSDYEAYKPKKAFAGFIQTIKYKQDLKIILGNLNSKNPITVFEIGAGRGEFLSEVKKAGLTVEGIEPGESGRTFAKNNFGIELQSGFASDIVFTKQYDVVVARHVLEHINEYNECLQLIYKAGLKNGGCIYLKLPCLNSWEAKLFGKFWHGYDLPRHRVHFSKSGIIKTLKTIGFEDIKVKEEVVPLDIVRSILYYSKHGNSLFLKFSAKVFSALPYIIKIGVSQTAGVLLSPFVAGRMIVTAKKNKA